jgi:hypothetical protein
MFQSDSDELCHVHVLLLLTSGGLSSETVTWCTPKAFRCKSSHFSGVYLLCIYEVFHLDGMLLVSSLLILRFADPMWDNLMKLFIPVSL